MMLLRLISWPYARRHAVRSLLTISGIAIGVAVFIAIHLGNQSVLRAFSNTVERIAGATQLQISAGEPGFDEIYLERIQALRQVKVAAPVIEAVVSTGLPGQGNLLILGVDMTGDRSLREYDLESAEDALIEDPLVFLAQPDSMMVTSEFARRNDLRIGSRIPLETIDGVKRFTIRGILRSSGMSSAFGGNLAIMDIYAVQYILGRGRRFDRIDVALRDGVTIREAEQALRNDLGPGFEVQPPATRGESFQSILRIYYLMMNFSSAFALVVGMFIIYNSFSIAVTQRRTEIGILRALGAQRYQIGLLFVGESLIGGIVGSALGLFAGYYGAAAIAETIASILHGVYGVYRPEQSIELSPSIVVLAVAAGVVTSVIAASFPARKAARVDPVQALSKGGARVNAEPGGRGGVIAALALGSAAAFLIFFSRSLGMFYAGYVCVIAAVILMTSRFSLLLGRLLRPVLKWLRPVEGALAADSITGSPRRTSATVGALMLSLALVIALGGTSRASYNSITRWVATALNPDMFISASHTLASQSYKFPDSMFAELQAIPGIRHLERVRNGRIRYQGHPILVMALELEKNGAVSPREAIEGKTPDMYVLAAAGKGVIASENFASMWRVHLGDIIHIPTPSGNLDLPVVGVVRDFSDQQGALLLDLSLYRKYWDDDSVDFFRIFVGEGRSPESVKQAILARYAGNRRLFVLSNEEVRRYVLRLTDQWFGMTRVQVYIAILVAILGIVNSLTVSIADRRRELGVLQAVGGLRSQVRGTIWMEAAGIALISLVLGFGLGAIQLYYYLEMSYRNFPGMRFDYNYPFGIAVVLAPIIVGAALFSALGPAESAVRGSLVEALEYE
jgi:putative ABC transport system permease protein